MEQEGDGKLKDRIFWTLAWMYKMYSKLRNKVLSAAEGWRLRHTLWICGITSVLLIILVSAIQKELRDMQFPELSSDWENMLSDTGTEEEYGVFEEEISEDMRLTEEVGGDFLEDTQVQTPQAETPPDMRQSQLLAPQKQEVYPGHFLAEPMEEVIACYGMEYEQYEKGIYYPALGLIFEEIKDPENSWYGCVGAMEIHAGEIFSGLSVHMTKGELMQYLYETNSLHTDWGKQLYEIGDNYIWLDMGSGSLDFHWDSNDAMQTQRAEYVTYYALSY